MNDLQKKTRMDRGLHALAFFSCWLSCWLSLSLGSCASARVEKAEIGPEPALEPAETCAKQLIGVQLYDAATAVYTWPKQLVRGQYALPHQDPKYGWELDVRVKATNIDPPHTRNHLYIVFFRDNTAVALGSPSYDSYDRYDGTVYTELHPPVPLPSAAKR